MYQDLPKLLKQDGFFTCCRASDYDLEHIMRQDFGKVWVARMTLASHTLKRVSNGQNSA